MTQPFTLAELNERHLMDLLRLERELGPAKYKMFKEGQWSGILNALDFHSPHCSTTEEQSCYWHQRGVDYINSWKVKYAAKEAKFE